MFGKSSERIRQWGLLGMLLKDLHLVDALGFMVSAFGGAAVNWALVRAQVAEGQTLSEAAEGQPPEVLAALQLGEKESRLPESLASLFVPVCVAVIVEVSASYESIVALVDEVLSESIQQRFPRIALRPGGAVEHAVEGGWRSVRNVPPATAAAMARRIWILAGQTYWAPKPGVFKIAVPFRGMFEFRVSVEPDGALILELTPPQ